MDWWTHGRLVNYDQPNPAEPEISNWLIQNPQRLNLGRIGFHFGGANVTETDLEQKSQTLDLWAGKISASFVYKGSKVQVETSVHPEWDTVGISVDSELLSTGDLGIFFDFPYPDLNKFDAPYVGVWNETDKHTTILQSSGNQATIHHILDSNEYFMTAEWEGHGDVTGPLPGTHRYILSVQGMSRLQLTTTFSPQKKDEAPSAQDVAFSAKRWWQSYWMSGGFIDLSSTKNESAAELQRRIILSQYICAVNSASHNPPQGTLPINVALHNLLC